MRAGDATFHAGWTLHGAAANPTPLLREVMTVIYFAEGTRVVDEPSQVQAHDLRAWLPGCVPGGIAASEINPLLA
jgi:ectoine hydroxylase-related dioxygenase (phytanoyl-CoA dioxygenase family)